MTGFACSGQWSIEGYLWRQELPLSCAVWWKAAPAWQKCLFTLKKGEKQKLFCRYSKEAGGGWGGGKGSELELCCKEEKDVLLFQSDRWQHASCFGNLKAKGLLRRRRIPKKPPVACCYILLVLHCCFPEVHVKILWEQNWVQTLCGMMMRSVSQDERSLHAVPELSSVQAGSGWGSKHDCLLPANLAALHKQQIRFYYDWF